MEKENICISRIHRIEGESTLKAFVDIVWCGIVVKGLRVVSGKKGLFLSMPRHQGKDGKWYNTVYPSTKEGVAQLNELVLKAYQQ